jgi:hypothetical protein
MCGLGALGILVFGWVFLLLAVIFGVAAWYAARLAVRRLRRRRAKPAA